MSGLRLPTLLAALVVAAPSAAANSTMTMECEGFGRVARFVFDSGMMTLEDFRNGEKIGGPSPLNVIAFDDIALRVVASLEDKTSDTATGLLTVFELDFANLFARETRFNTTFALRTETGWVYDRCRRLD